MYYFLRLFMILSRCGLHAELVFAYLLHIITFHSKCTEMWISRINTLRETYPMAAYLHTTKIRLMIEIKETYDFDYELLYSELLKSMNRKRTFYVMHRAFGSRGDVELTLSWLLGKNIIDRKTYIALKNPSHPIYVKLDIQAKLHKRSCLDLSTLRDRWVSRRYAY